jgi:hypothetical protein
MLRKSRPIKNQLVTAALEALEDRKLFTAVAAPSSLTLDHWMMDWTAFTTPQVVVTSADSSAPSADNSSSSPTASEPVVEQSPVSTSPTTTTTNTTATTTTVTAASTTTSSSVAVEQTPTVASTPVVTTSPSTNSTLLPTFTYVTPASNPALASGMNTFTPPVGSQAAAANAPIIGMSDQTAASNQSIVLTGSQFTSYTGANANQDTQFVVYGQTSASNPTLTNAQIQDVSSQGATVTIDPSEPANSMYLIWAENSNGASAPIAINQTQAWWMGAPGETLQTAQGQLTVNATVGQTMSVYGKNLSNGAATPQSWVYLQPTDGSAGQWAQVTSVNPYQVDFTAPSTPGTYQVWANNGLGGQYGWSEVTQNGTPVVLQVAPATTAWSGTTINVEDYGATGNGVTDDGAAILKAIAAASALTTTNNTLYLPAGTYLISGGEQLMLPSNLRILGDGTGQTTIDFQGPVNTNVYNYGVPYEIGWTDGNAKNVEIDSITIEHTGSSVLPKAIGASSNVSAMVMGRGGQNITLNNVNLVGNDLDPLALNGSDGITLENSSVEGSGMSFIWASNVFVNNCDFYESYMANSMIALGGSSNVSITNSSVQNANNDTTDWSGAGEGRFIEYNLDFGNADNQYIAGNQTDLGAPIAGNNGEQINIEGQSTNLVGSPTTASGDTLTFSSAAMLSNPAQTNAAIANVGDEVIVDAGPGMGEMRTVTAVSYTYNADGSKSSVTLTLNSPFNVTPNSSSTVFVGTTASNAVFYQNTLQDQTGVRGWPGNLHAATGLEVWGGSYDLIFDDNTVADLGSGVTLTSAGTYNPTFFNQIYNNTFQNDGTGVDMGGTDGNDPSLNYLGTIVRGNMMTTTIYGVNLSLIPTGSDLLTVLENNAIAAPVGVEVYNDPDVLVRQNTFNPAPNPTNSAQVPQAIVYSNSSAPTVLLQNNTLQGYASGQTGIATGTTQVVNPPLQAPYRVISVTATAGSSTQISLPIANDGMSNLSWTATTAASWLALSATSGVVPAQSGSTAALVADAAALTPGQYQTTVTLSDLVAGVPQSQVVTILLTVQ